MRSITRPYYSLLYLTYSLHKQDFVYDVRLCAIDRDLLTITL